MTEEAPQEKYREIIRKLPPASIMEQLAEELVELTHAVQKQARIVRGENPTPADLVDVIKEVNEELCDVFVCLDILDLTPDPNLALAKMDRWARRVNSAYPDHVDPLYGEVIDGDLDFSGDDE